MLASSLIMMRAIFFGLAVVIAGVAAIPTAPTLPGAGPASGVVPLAQGSANGAKGAAPLGIVTGTTGSIVP